MNVYAKELGILNISFKCLDLNKGMPSNFDLVISFSVIYCLNNHKISEYFKSLIEAKSKDGIVIVGCTSNLSPILNATLKIKTALVKLRLTNNPLTKLDFKQIGWLRNSHLIQKEIPTSIKIQKIIYTNHYHKAYPKIISFISEKIYPLTNAGYIFILK